MPSRPYGTQYALVYIIGDDILLCGIYDWADQIGVQSHHESLSPDILSPVGCGHLRMRLQQLSFEFPTCLPHVPSTF